MGRIIRHNIILIIFLLLFIGCANQRIRTGRTVDFIGPKNDSFMYWIDTDLKNYKPLEINIHTFIFEKRKNIKIRFGLGGRLGIEKKIKEVRLNGDRALIEYTREFDGYDPEDMLDQSVVAVVNSETATEGQYAGKTFNRVSDILPV